ncbi:MAG: hypothetical protein K6F52_05815 [Clostridia bacterium]|nr:hypothetical protein [Clostridia bacterium]
MTSNDREFYMEKNNSCGRKEILLANDEPFFNNVDVTVYDFPNGRDAAKRKRCAITVEFAEADIRRLIEKGLDFAEAEQYYREWIYSTVKRYISYDWVCVGGLEELMAIVKERLGLYYR